MLLAAERESSGALDVVRTAYDEFLAVNPDLIQVCTDWQLQPDGSLNDHTDDRYDADVIEALGAIDRRIHPVCERLGGQVARFGAYGPRLSGALARVRAGDGKWFTSPAVESYHTVWFELHEDMLQTLGITREQGGPVAVHPSAEPRFSRRPALGWCPTLGWISGACRGRRGHAGCESR